MKKVFKPSMDDLYIMQDYTKDKGSDIYKYLLVKAAESLIMESVYYSNKGIFKTAYKYLCEDADLSRIVCSMYPDEMVYSNQSQEDVELCQKLITREKNDEIYKLDELSRFSSLVQMNLPILIMTIDELSRKLPNNPNYRFEYNNRSVYGQNIALDNIFSKDLSNTLMGLDLLRNEKTSKKLTMIEPGYILDILEQESLYDDDLEKIFNQGLNEYFNRYFVNKYAGSEYKGKDILTNPDIKVKRLIKTINQNAK